LRNRLRALAAEVVAADILPLQIYVPSEHDPADLPSRGKRLKVDERRRIHKPKPTSRFGTRSEREMLVMIAAV